MIGMTQSAALAVMSGSMKNAAIPTVHIVPTGPKILWRRFSVRKGQYTMQRNGSEEITCIKQRAGPDMNGAEND